MEEQGKWKLLRVPVNALWGTVEFLHLFQRSQMNATIAKAAKNAPHPTATAWLALPVNGGLDAFGPVAVPAAVVPSVLLALAGYGGLVADMRVDKALTTVAVLVVVLSVSEVVFVVLVLGIAIGKVPLGE